MNALGVYYIQPKKKCLVAARQQGTEGVLYTYIGVGLSALLVSTGWAMRRPLSVGRATGTVPTLFLLLIFWRGTRERQVIIIMLIDQKATVYLNYLDEHPHFYAKEHWIDRQYTTNGDISEYAATFYILQYDEKFIGVLESSRPNTATYLYSFPDDKKLMGLYAYVYERHLAEPLISRDMNDFYKEIVKKGNQLLRDKQKWEKENPDYLMCDDYEQAEECFLYNPCTPIKYRSYFIDEVRHVTFKDWSNRLENAISSYLKGEDRESKWLKDGIDLILFSFVYDLSFYVVII